MEHITNFLRELGPWATTLLLTILVPLLHKVNRGIDSLRETKVKAELSFEEISDRVPEYGRRYKTWLANR